MRIRPIKLDSADKVTSNTRLRKFCRFSLKMFFVFVALLSIILATWLSRARRQKQAVAVLRDNFSASVLYDHSSGRKKPRITDWFVDFVGVDAFFNVILVSVNDSDFSDSDLVHLSRFSKLNCLRLAGCQVTGEGLLAVKDLRNLRELYLIDVPIGDEAVVHLKAMSQLQWLNVKDTKITDAGVQTLREQLPKCQTYGKND